MNEDTRPFRTGRRDRRSGDEGSNDTEAESDPRLRSDGGSRDEPRDPDPVEEPVEGPMDDPISEQMDETVEEPVEEPVDQDDSNVTRSKAFHEASGSFRDVGIAILILLILAAIVWILFVL